MNAVTVELDLSRWRAVVRHLDDRAYSLVHDERDLWTAGFVVALGDRIAEQLPGPVHRGHVDPPAVDVAAALAPYTDVVLAPVLGTAGDLTGEPAAAGVAR